MAKQVWPWHPRFTYFRNRNELEDAATGLQGQLGAGPGKLLDAIWAPETPETTVKPREPPPVMLKRNLPGSHRRGTLGKILDVFGGGK